MQLIIPQIPRGLWFDSKGLVLDIADQNVRALIKAAYHQVQLVEQTTPGNVLPFGKTVDDHLLVQLFKE